MSEWCVPSGHPRGNSPGRALLHLSLVAMVMGFPVVPVVIMVMMTVPLIKAMAVRFRPMVMGMLVPVLMAVDHLRGMLMVMVRVVMVMGMFV